MEINTSFDDLKSPTKELLLIPMGTFVHSKRDIWKNSFKL